MSALGYAIWLTARWNQFHLRFAAEANVFLSRGEFISLKSIRCEHRDALISVGYFAWQ